MHFPIPSELDRILKETPELHQAFLVGGCVRDWLRGHPNTDFDIEVFGIGYTELVESLRRWGVTDLVGRSFGVVKLRTRSGAVFDFTVARRDSKVGPGHKGFEIEFDPNLTPREAAARRDFTINALMYDPRAGRVLDFFGGQSDLEQGILRHTSDAFVEDPLRVLRGMQFAARFNLRAAPETVELCRLISDRYGELAVERVRDEWFKWASKSTVPSRGLQFLAETGWMVHFPEIAALQTTPQDPEWHPEGDVFVHTCHCCDAMAKLPEWQNADQTSRIVYMLAILAHDFGKPPTTTEAIKDGRKRIVSPGHEEAGAPLAERFLERIGAPRAIVERVIPLVVYHLAHLQTLSDRSVRRLAKRLEPETIEGLCIVMTADHMGRPPKPARTPESVVALRAKAAELRVRSEAPRPILLGRHLIQLGLPPGPKFGLILEKAYDAQLEGHIRNLEEACYWLVSEPGLPLEEAERRQIRERAGRLQEARSSRG